MLRHKLIPLKAE